MTGKFTKPKSKVLLAVSACLFGIALGLFSQRESPHPHRVIDISGVEEGDLVFRRKSGLISEMARNLSLSERRFSHVGIVVARQGSPAVMHAISEESRGFDGVVTEPLDQFLADSADWGIYRAQASKEERLEIGHWAKRLRDMSSGFDKDFSLDSDEQLYCTEFVWKVLKHAFPATRISPANTLTGQPYIPLDEIYRNPLFRPLSAAPTPGAPNGL